MDNFGFTPRTENQSFPVLPLRKSISNTPFSWVMTRVYTPGYLLTSPWDSDHDETISRPEHEKACPPSIEHFDEYRRSPSRGHLVNDDAIVHERFVRQWF